jgi:AcrR family transcriptional regulator
LQALLVSAILRSMIGDVEQPGLRERKRVRTRGTIARVALELFDRQGFQETTIPQIAEAADVSPRTVSAYFPHKEELAFADSEEAFESLDARLRDRVAGESATDALRGWIEDWLGRHVDDEELVTRRRVINADERLRAYEHRFLLRAQQAIAAAIARDLGVPAGALEPRMAAAAMFTIFDLLGEDSERRPRAESLELLDRALLFIGAGIRALRA